MAELIHEHTRHLTGPDGREYDVLIYARQVDGLWEAWLEFRPLGGGLILRTERETTQSSRHALTYWATGLGPVYLEGALERAVDHAPQASL